MNSPESENATLLAPSVALLGCGFVKCKQLMPVQPFPWALMLHAKPSLADSTAILLS